MLTYLLIIIAWFAAGFLAHWICKTAYRSEPAMPLVLCLAMGVLGLGVEVILHVRPRIEKH